MQINLSAGDAEAIEEKWAPPVGIIGMLGCSAAATPALRSWLFAAVHESRSGIIRRHEEML